jgi:RNA polymerase sigma-70 factor, ECF subfamily
LITAKSVAAQPEARFRSIVERHLTPVSRFLHRFVDDPAVAERLAEDVFAQAYKVFRSDALAASCDTWLFRRALRAAARSARGTALDAETTPAMPIRRAMAALPAAQRAAVLMHKYETFDCSKIAAILGCSDSAVQLLLSQAYQNLRGQIRGAGVETAHAMSNSGAAY